MKLDDFGRLWKAEHPAEHLLLIRDKYLEPVRRFEAEVADRRAEVIVAEQLLAQAETQLEEFDQWLKDNNLTLPPDNRANTSDCPTAFAASTPSASMHG